MSTLLDEFVAKYATAGVVIDTNIVVLRYVGTHDRSLIPRYKRTLTFTPDDYDLLLRLLKFFGSVITTPHILAESCNLLGELAEPVRSQVLTLLAQSMASQQEVFETSIVLTQASPYPRLELTDSAIVDLARRGFGVVSDDMELVTEVFRVGALAINFNNLRDAAWA